MAERMNGRTCNWKDGYQINGVHVHGRMGGMNDVRTNEEITDERTEAQTYSQIDGLVDCSMDGRTDEAINEQKNGWKAEGAEDSGLVTVHLQSLQWKLIIMSLELAN